MNFQCVETFLAVINNRTISQAANVLYVSQSTVSGRLKQLEEELQVTLIERKKGVRGVELTEKGKQFALLAERYVQLEKEIEYFMHDTDRWHLTIAASSSVLSCMFPVVLSDMMKNEKDLNLRLCSPNAQAIYQMIDAYEADVGILFNISGYDNVMTKLLLEEKMVVVLSPQNCWPNRPLSTKELDPAHEIRLRWSADIVRWHENQWDPSIRPYVYLEDFNLLSEMLRTLPKSWALCTMSAAQYLQSVVEGVQIRACAEGIPDRKCYFITRRNASEQSRLAVEKLKAYLFPFIDQQEYYQRYLF